MATGPGALYVVATPIGNLEDITLRALRVLKEADLIAAEDTRRTLKLLTHYGIRKPLVSVREHNEAREAPRLLQRIAGGERIALVSDAGTPAIADPGARLVQAVRSAGLPVVPVPGPSAVTAALSVSGLDEPEFTFMGFPPPGGAARRAWFELVALEPRTVVFFEAPHRLERTLADILEFVNRPILIHKEISKIHEMYGESHNVRPVGRAAHQGELTLVVRAPGHTQHGRAKLGEAELRQMVGRLTDCGGFSPMDIATIVSTVGHVSVLTARKAVKKYNISVKQLKRGLP